MVMALCFIAIPIALYTASFLPSSLVDQWPILILFVLWIGAVAALIALYLLILRSIGRLAR